MFVYFSWAAKYHAMVWMAIPNYSCPVFGHIYPKGAARDTASVKAVDARNKLAALIACVKQFQNSKLKDSCIAVYCENELFRWDAEYIKNNMPPENTDIAAWDELRQQLKVLGKTLDDVVFYRKGLFHTQMWMEADEYMCRTLKRSGGGTHGAISQ